MPFGQPVQMWRHIYRLSLDQPYRCEVTSIGRSIINLVLFRYLWFTLWTLINAQPSLNITLDFTYHVYLFLPTKLLSNFQCSFLIFIYSKMSNWFKIFQWIEGWRGFKPRISKSQVIGVPYLCAKKHHPDRCILFQIDKYNLPKFDCTLFFSTPYLCVCISYFQSLCLPIYVFPS